MHLLRLPRPCATGALEFLHDALAALCIKINASKVPSLQRLIRQWADEVLLLLLPHARAAGMEPHQQQHPATILLRAFRMPLNVRRGTIGPPPPVRKSKSLGFVFRALLGGKLFILKQRTSLRGPIWIA